MSKSVIRIFCLVLAIITLLCAASCKESTSDEQSSKQSNNESSLESNGEIGLGSNESGSADVPSGNTDDFISNIDPQTTFYLPYSKLISQSDLEEVAFPENDEIIGPDDPGIDDVVFGEVDNPIQMNGEPVKGANRVFNVDTTSVVYDDFVGHGSNVFPTQLMPEALERYSFLSDVALEVERDRWMAIKGHMYRSWFQVDWITTTDEPNPKRKDYKNNIDYQNYKKGIYDFDSEKMKDVYPYLDVWKDSGSEVCINFGWKCSTEIQAWFCFPGIPDAQSSAPLELDPFGRAAATTIKELRHNRGYDNITMLSFYNEPGDGWDFHTYLDDYVYWALMLQHTNKWLEKLDVDDEVRVWSCGESSVNPTKHHFTSAIKELCVDEFDIYDAHYYYSTSYPEAKENNYENAYKLFAYLRTLFNEHPFYITENYCCDYAGSDNTRPYQWWNDSTASFLIAGANTGIRCLLSWGYTGGCLPDPQLFNPAGHDAGLCWDNVDSAEMLNKPVSLTFYETSLITNYIPAHSDVLQVDWTGEDIRGSAFKTPDGGYSILIEANGSEDKIDKTEKAYKTTKRNLTINLSGNNKNLKFYKYRFNNDDALAASNCSATVITHDEIIDAKKKLVDEIDETHAMYIYTTVPPAKQIEIKPNGDTILRSIQAGDSLDLEAEMLDCDSDDQIVWSISATNYKDGYNGKMTGYDGDMSNPNIFGTGNTATYQAPHSLSPCMIAIRASLKSDPKVFDVVVVQITA